MNASDIINWVQQIKDNWKTNDPYAIAAHLGIQVIFSDALGKDFTAYTVGFTNCPTMITINNNYSELSKRILCAHELGHALLHSDISINHFAVNSSNINTSVEWEANLFAIAFFLGFNADLAPWTNLLILQSSSKPLLSSGKSSNPPSVLHQATDKNQYSADSNQDSSIPDARSRALLQLQQVSEAMLFRNRSHDIPEARTNLPDRFRHDPGRSKNYENTRQILLLFRPLLQK